jgi:hypothetical protein
MIVVDEYNVWDKQGATCHLNVRAIRYFDGCDLDQIKEYLLVEGMAKLKSQDKEVDIDSMVVLLAFTQK